MTAGPEDWPLESPAVSASPRRAALVFIFVTVVLDMLAVGMIAPVLPKLVETMLGGDTVHAAYVYGLFGAVWALMQFFFSPVQGALSDRVGRRPVILISNFGLGFDYILMALAPTVGWLFAGRVISGITSASISTAGAYIADVTPVEKRAAGFGMIGAAFGLGFIVGPALGGLLGNIGPRLPFWVAAGLSIMNGMYGIFVLPESLPPDRRGPFSLGRANPIGSLRVLGAHAELLGLSVVHFLHRLAHDVLPSTMVLYVGYRYGWDARAMGLMVAAVGAGSVLVQGTLVRPIVSTFGERRALLAGLLFGVVAFAIFGLAPEGRLFIVGVPFMSLWGLTAPSLQSLMTRRLGASEQGRLQGALASLQGIAGLFGPVLFTQTFAAFLVTRHGRSLPGAPFFLASTLLVVAVGVATAVMRDRSD
jgi:MFS transporter, DHA1 family, tetracycline resistance protein